MGSDQRPGWKTRVDTDSLGVKGVKEALVEMGSGDSCHSYLGAMKHKAPPVVTGDHIQYMRGHVFCARDGRRHVDDGLSDTGEKEGTCEDCFAFIGTLTDGRGVLQQNDIQFIQQSQWDLAVEVDHAQRAGQVPVTICYETSAAVAQAGACHSLRRRGQYAQV